MCCQKIKNVSRRPVPNNLNRIELIIEFNRFNFQLYANIFHFSLSDMMLVASFTTTRKKKRKLLIDKHEFVMDRKLKSSINWRCARYRSANCKVRATTYELKSGQEVYRIKYAKHSHQWVMAPLNQQSSTFQISLSLDLLFVQVKSIDYFCSFAFLGWIVTTN